MDKSEKTGTGINKFVDHVVKDMFNNIIVEKGFIDFAMPYHERATKTRTGIIINYDRWFNRGIESSWHRETILEELEIMVRYHLDKAYGISWKDTKTDDSVTPISLNLYDIIVKRIHKLWENDKWINESLPSHRYMRKGDYSEKEINKQKKQDEFIEYVVSDLINDTYIDRITFNDRPISGGEKIDTPFFRINKIGAQSFLGIVGMSGESRELFNDYIKNKYGAAMEGEMNKIFMFYTEEIKELVKDKNTESFTYTDNLDESISKKPKQQQLFDYVVKQMVDGTRIVPPGDGTLLLIIPDFINAENASPFLYGRYLKTPTFPIPTYVMLRYFKSNYGLVNDEIQLVWDRYREIMYRKLSKEYPNSFLDDPPVEEMFPHSINESKKYKVDSEFKKIDNPKQHEFFNKIADKVVELTEVRDEQWGKNIFLTDLLDPAFPGQGMSLPPAINMSDYETFQKRMLTIVHDFFPMLEKYWFIEGIFDQIFILTKFVFPKLWNNFYKGEDQPEVSTDYGEHALDYEEDMGKEKITMGSNTSWNDVTNNESIDNKLFNVIENRTGKINESKEDVYIDKIVDQIIDETYIVKEKRTPRRGKSKWLYFVRNPFMRVTPNYRVFLYVLSQMVPSQEFEKHCREIYGATPAQIKDIWNTYSYYLSEIKPEFNTDSDNLRKAIEPINESTYKQQKFLDTILKDMVNTTTIYRSEFDVDTIMLPSGEEIYTFYGWKPDVNVPTDSLRKYMIDTYGLTKTEGNHIWMRYRDIMMDRIKRRDGDNNPFRITEGEHKSTHKIIDKVYKEIGNDLIIDKESVFLDLPYFRGLKGILASDEPPQIFYDPFHSDVERFDTNYVLGELKRFVAYHLLKTMGIGYKLQMRNYDPMVEPIAKKLLKDIYKEAVEKGFINYDSLDELNLNESQEEVTMMNTVNFDKIGKVLRDPANSEQIYELLIDMFPNAKEVIDYNYYGDNEEPNPNDTFAEMKGFLWDIDNNIIKGPDLKLSTGFEIDSEYKEDLEQRYNEYIEGKLDKFFRESPDDPRDITPEQFEKMPPIMVMNGEVMDGNHRAFLAQKAGAKLPTFEIMVEPNTHPNAQKILSIIHPNDSDEDGIPNRLDISQQPNLNESVDWSDKKGNKYHRNGMVNRVVGDFLKMIELTHQSVIFHMSQYVESPQRTHNDPYLTYIYDENGLTQESKDLLYEGITNGIQWYMEHTGLIDYHPPHYSNNARPPEDVELIKMIADTLHPLIIKEVTDYNEDEGWTRDTLYTGKFLRESTDKQEQYINNVIKHLMDNTKWADFGGMGAINSQLLLNDIISMTTYINYGEFGFNFIPHDVADILKGFGLTKQETDKVWDIYSWWVLEKVMREGSVNWPNKETHKKRYPFLTESKNNTDKFAEKIAKEIIGASTLSGKLLYFYPPVVEEAKDEGPISADVNSEWIHNDMSTGVYHLTTDIRRIGRLYIKKIMGPGIDREDPIFKQVNDIVIDNILQRARNHDWMKEVGGMRDLRDKHGFLRESTQPQYLDKIFNSVIKEIRFDVDKYGAVVIPFISRERYSSTTGVLDNIEYQISKHDRNIELRDEGVLHSAFNSYLKEIYGLGEEEAYEVYDRVRQYIKDELYYRSVLQQILQSVQDDYIEGYGAKIDITPERTIDLKNYDDFKEYLDWWHGIVESDDDIEGGVFSGDDNMVKKLYDEVWDTLKNTITLNEGWPAEPELDKEGNEKWDRMFPDKFYLKMFKMIDKDPEFFMKEILQNLGFESEEEYDILYNYFVNYSDRKDYYVDFTIDPDDIASFFDDRDYDLEKMVKGLLEGDWDYHEWYNESFEFSDYFLDYIDEDSWKEIAKILEVDNIADAKELMSGDIGSEHLESHYELMEMRIEDIQNIIAHSTTEAQADADITYLHNDIMDEVNDWFKFGEFNTHQGEFVGSVELGDVMTESSGLLQLEAELSEGYPTFDEVVNNILSEELNDWGYQDEYIFTGDEKPYINTDKHFRYGGAGTMNNEHFNEMFIDRLGWDYST